MGLTGATADTYRLQAPTGAEWTSDAYTICGWVTLDVSNSNRDGIFSNLNSAVAGFTFRLDSLATKLDFLYVDSGGANRLRSYIHADIAVGNRLFMYGCIDGSGNGSLGHVLGGVNQDTPFSGLAPINALSVRAPTLGGHVSGNFDQKLLGTMEDIRVYNARLSLAEILSIEASAGRAVPQPDALISRLPLLDAAPGVDTDTTVPLDTANPARAWSVAGSGVASVWAASLAPLRRKPS